MKNKLRLPEVRYVPPMPECKSPRADRGMNRYEVLYIGPTGAIRIDIIEAYSAADALTIADFNAARYRPAEKVYQIRCVK